MKVPRTQYAKSGSIHVAYQVFGEGEVDLVLSPGFISHVEHCWAEPRFARWLTRLGQGCRVVLFDKRGTGLSDHVREVPTMDERMDDVRAVMDAIGLDKAAHFGYSEGGSLAALFAATHPERCNSLVLYGAFARFRDWFPAPEPLFEYMEHQWGSGQSLPNFAPSHSSDEALIEWWGCHERFGASPSAAMDLIIMDSEIDVSHALPTICVPTLVLHRVDDSLINVVGGRELAKLIPGAKMVELAGADHFPFVGETSDAIIDETHQFITGSRGTRYVERVLATVMFEDIVDSTRKLEEMGDHSWRATLGSHDAVVRRELSKYSGREIKSLGDGFLATFDGPSRAVHCAHALSNAVRLLGIEVRVGLHSGEIEIAGDDVLGISVHTASRIAHEAGPSEVYVSRTVRDLVAGSGIKFAKLGARRMKGIDEPLDLFSVEQ